MKFSAFFSLCFVLGIFPALPAQGVVRPEDLAGILSRQNQAVRSSHRLIEGAAARKGHLIRSFLPNLVLEGGVERFQTGPYPTRNEPYGSVELRANLFRGGKDLLEARVRDAEWLSAQSESALIRSHELGEARRSYWGLVYLGEEVSILEAALELNSKHLASANRRIDRGLATATDRLEFEIQRSQLKEDLESARHQMHQAQIRLRAVLGMGEGQGEKDSEVETIRLAPHEHDDPLRERPVTSTELFEATLAQSVSTVTQLRGSQLRRWWMPSLDAYAGVYRYTLRDRDYLESPLLDDRVVGVRLSLALDPLQSMSDSRGAALRAEAMEGGALQRFHSERSRYRVAQESMKHEHDLIHEAEERIAQGSRYLSQTLDEYNRGLKNGPDVLGASQRLIGFRRRFAEVRRDYQLAKVELLSVLGQ